MIATTRNLFTQNEAILLVAADHKLESTFHDLSIAYSWVRLNNDMTLVPNEWELQNVLLDIHTYIYVQASLFVECVG